MQVTAMDANSVSVLWYRRSKPLGKVRRRVQDLRIPSFCSCDFTAVRPMLDLSHNESARLAVDCLLSRGSEGYHKVLDEEGEVDFLSELEKNYILKNGRDGNTADPGASDSDTHKELGSLSAGSQSATQFPAVSTDSDPTVEGLGQNSIKDVKTTDTVMCETSVGVYFQSDSRAAGMKDLVREFIRKAYTALAIVMDSFSDVELLCDLLEASRKRNVSVHLLLDHLNLNMFVTMWQELKLSGKNFPKLSVRSVDGQTYCAKTGRKLTGQIAESFIITDWAEVLTGSFSFSWLSWQVHRSLAVLVKGNAVTPFHQEFRRLYSSSKPVLSFVTFITLPLYITSQAAQKDNTGISKSKARQEKTASQWALNEDAQKTMQSVSVEKPTHTLIGVRAQHDGKIHVEPLEKSQNQIQSHSKTTGQTHVSYNQSQLSSLSITNRAEENEKVQGSASPHTTHPTHRQHRTVCYQSTLKNSNLDHISLGAEGLFFQQRNRHRLTNPSGTAAGLNTQRGQRHYSLNSKLKVELQSNNPKLLSPTTSQQKQAKTGLQFPFTHSRGHTSWLQTKVSSLGTRRQDQPQKHHQPPHQLHPATEVPASKLTSTAMGTQLKPQLQTNSELLSVGTRAKLHLQPHTPQQAKPPPRLNWMLQSHTARPQPVAPTSSFDAAYGTGQTAGGQPGWRPAHSNRNTSLGRSKSLTDRQAAEFKGTGLNQNINNT